MPQYRTQLGQSLGQTLANAAGGGGEYEKGQLIGAQQGYYQAQAKDKLADVALKQKRLAIDPMTMATNQMGAFGSIAQQLKDYAKTGQSDSHEQPIAYGADGEVDFNRSGPANNVTPEMAKQFGQAINAFTYAESGKFKDTAEGMGAMQSNNLVQQIASGQGDIGNITKALLAARGKGAFDSFNGGAIDTTTGAQALNAIGDSLVNQHNASATQSNAGAQENLAQAGLARVRAVDAPNVNWQTLQTDTGFQQVNPRTGEIRPLGVNPKALGSGLQNVPPMHRMAYGENSNALRQIDDTIRQIEANPDALGLQNFFGDNVSQRTDPNGVPIRAAVAQVGGVKLHNLSGAAVSPAESKRLMPMIPTSTDSADAAVKKLRNLRKEYAGINSEIETMYSGDIYRNPIGSAVPISSGNINVDIQNPERLSDEDRRALQADIAKEQQKALHESDSLPGAARFPGKILTDANTGRKYKSVNNKWVEQ